MSYVGVVILSHSRELVKGLQQLLLQIQPNVPLAIAGGAGIEIGTELYDIKEAIESVYSDKGVVILFDLGSALLNAELAIEMMDQPDHILIADAPLVEGAYAAIIESGCGSSVDEVVEAAENAKMLMKIRK